MTVNMWVLWAYIFGKCNTCGPLRATRALLRNDAANVERFMKKAKKTTSPISKL